MANKRFSFISKGWLIIGIVMLIAGFYLIFIANSLYYDVNQLEEYSNQETYNSMIEEVTRHVSVNAFFLVLISLIIIVIGAIMCVEWALFSKFMQRYSEK